MYQYQLSLSAWTFKNPQTVISLHPIGVAVVVGVVVISLTTDPTSKAKSYKPEGTSREGSPVRKGKRKGETINNKYILTLNKI